MRVHCSHSFAITVYIEILTHVEFARLFKYILYIEYIFMIQIYINKQLTISRLIFHLIEQKNTNVPMFVFVLSETKKKFDYVNMFIRKLECLF